MYVSLRDRPRPAPPRGRRARVAAPVVLLGVTSMFTDISSEMVAAVLPLFVTVGLGLSPLAFGVVDGLYQGVSAVTRLAGGYVADRTRRPKAVATTGYALSAASKLALLPVGSLPALSAAVAIDRTGKGIRTAPRDALIAARRRAIPGPAFGVHRALDTAGAMIGPLLAFVLLALLPGDFDAVFVVASVSPSLGWRSSPYWYESSRCTPPGRHDHAERTSLGSCAGPPSAACSLRPGCSPWHRSATDSSISPCRTVRDFRQRSSRCSSWERRSSTWALPFPLGRLADRIGRIRVFLGGQLVLAGAYCWHCSRFRARVSVLRDNFPPRRLLRRDRRGAGRDRVRPRACAGACVRTRGCPDRRGRRPPRLRPGLRSGLDRVGCECGAGAFLAALLVARSDRDATASRDSLSGGNSR